MAEAESGRTPGRWPTIMLDATCTAYCDTLTAAIGSATYPTLPASRARSLHHLGPPPPPPHFSSRNVYCGSRSGALSSMAAAAVDSPRFSLSFFPSQQGLVFVYAICSVVRSSWMWKRFLLYLNEPLLRRRGVLNGDGTRAVSAAGEQNGILYMQENNILALSNMAISGMK